MSDATPAARGPAHVVTVDFARGLLAVAVMAYHYLHLESIAHVERVAYYAVYAFFVVSGFALFLRYQGQLNSAEDVRRYLARRAFRIAPLFYIAIVLHVLLVGPEAAQGYKVLWSASLLFGFANPGSSSLLMGGWSIGIEMVFYLLLPFLVWTLRSIQAIAVATVAALVFSAAFVNLTLEGQQAFNAALWSAYTQPAAFLGYFLAGILLAAIFTASPAKGSIWPLLVTTAALVPFLLVRVAHPIELLVGWRGMLLTAATIACIGGAVYLREPTGWARPIAKAIGGLSYPIYLLHPLAYLAASKLGIVSTWPRLLLAMALTLLFSLLVQRLVEIPARALGRRIFP
jgi:exopolysaccharide production protein ExoZ